MRNRDLDNANLTSFIVRVRRWLVEPHSRKSYESATNVMKKIVGSIHPVVHVFLEMPTRASVDCGGRW